MEKEKIYKIIKDENIRLIDLKAIDLPGRLHHLSLPVKYFTEEVINEGVGFDGSSYNLVKVESSDMVLIPVLDSFFHDPFHEIPTLSFLTTMHFADPERTRYPMDPRYVLEKSIALLRREGIGHDLMWGPEYEFYLFNHAEFYFEPLNSGFHLNSEDHTFYNGYHREMPEDTFATFRDKSVELLQKEGIDVKYHHHEVGQSGQQEIETKFAPTIKTADNSIKIKYFLKNLSTQMGLFLTFMPKPIFNQAGTGWHLHQFMINGGDNLFYSEKGYSNLSPLAMNYIGGLLYHAKSLAAFTNASINSYKRLNGGFEAPAAISFAKGNRSSAIRIPGYVRDPLRTRIEFRTPDFTGNPYLILAAIIMAGIDGIKKGLDPVEMGFGPAEEGKAVVKETMPSSLEEALKELEDDYEYLLEGEVFTTSLIEKWIETKRKEIEFINSRPSPAEFLLYF